jgi:hypothetical protein
MNEHETVPTLYAAITPPEEEEETTALLDIEQGVVDGYGSVSESNDQPGKFRALSSP